MGPVLTLTDPQISAISGSTRLALLIFAAVCIAFALLGVIGFVGAIIDETRHRGRTRGPASPPQEAPVLRMDELPHKAHLIGPGRAHRYEYAGWSVDARGNVWADLVDLSSGEVRRVPASRPLAETGYELEKQADA